MAIRTVDIRPGVSALAVLRHLNYRPWYALAEFVDNAVESLRLNRESLELLYGPEVTLRVDIELDSSTPPSLTIRDNAGGIAATEYERAFRPAAIPPNREGLAEFGMGMKSAACWFAPRWSVRTSALGEPVSRTVRFDIDHIVDDKIEELSIVEIREDADNHYTEIVLEDIFHVPVGRTVGKIKQHLTDIYREFLRAGRLELRFKGERLVYVEPNVLVAPYYKDESSVDREWRKKIEFDFGNSLGVRGFAAIRAVGSTSSAGFALFRRGRVIQGSGDEGYRPSTVFGSTNSFRYQRLFGELHLEGFEVSHTKDGFRWDDNEQPFLDLLREHLDSGDLPLLRQAEGYRALPARSEMIHPAEQAVISTTRALESRIAEAIGVVNRTEPLETPTERLPVTSSIAGRSFGFVFRDRPWRINVELTGDPATNDWVEVADSGSSVDRPRVVNIRVSTAHPFMIRFAHTDSEKVDALLRVATAIALAEIIARDSGVRYSGTVRRMVSDILRYSLSES